MASKLIAALVLVFGIILGAFGATASGVPTQADAVDFQSLEQVRSIAQSGPAVLYFHASWCPVCKATMVNFQARWEEVKPGITLVLVDYDKEAELKAKYGVTFQNTFVQVAPDGKKIAIWNGGGIEALNKNTSFK